MEGEQSSGIIVILATSAILLIVALFVTIVVIYKRRIHAKQAVIDLLQNECKGEIAALKHTVERLDSELKELKS